MLTWSISWVPGTPHQRPEPTSRDSAVSFYCGHLVPLVCALLGLRSRLEATVLSWVSTHALESGPDGEGVEARGGEKKEQTTGRASICPPPAC